LEVQEASYAHGLLAIDLKVVSPEQRVKSIPIRVEGAPPPSLKNSALKDAAE
jgi:hypothetical protein